MAQSVGLIGGTGPEGKGLAVRFALAGLKVVLGSRSKERGEEAAREVSGVSDRTVRGGTNEDAAAAELIVLTVPYSALADTLPDLATTIGSKIVVSAVVPLQFSKGKAALLHVADGSAAEEAQRLLPDANLVGAFHNLSASHLLDAGHALEGDVLICGDDADAVAEVCRLAELIPDLRAVRAGPIASSQLIEAVTALLLNINRSYKAEAHIKILGV